MGTIDESAASLRKRADATEDVGRRRKEETWVPIMPRECREIADGIDALTRENERLTRALNERSGLIGGSIMHPQLWVKVNAQVDERMASIIEALSAFPTLQTIESCQRSAGTAWVSFAFGESWRDLAKFIFGFLAPRLRARVGDAVEMALRPSSSTDLIFADLTIRPEGLGLVHEALRNLAAEFIRDHDVSAFRG